MDCASPSYAGGRNRTDMVLLPGDFESPASTNFTTPASTGSKNNLVMVVCQLRYGPDCSCAAGGNHSQKCVRSRTVSAGDGRLVRLVPYRYPRDGWIEHSSVG